MSDVSKVINREAAGLGVALTLDEFNRIKELLYSKVGISLTEKKMALVVNRLRPVLRRMEFTSYTDYLNWLERDSTGRGLDELVNKLTTNFTFFNREKAHFEYLGQHVMPEITTALKKKGSKDFRLWCAAASTGEEPYMLAMVLQEFFHNEAGDWQAGLLATDVSRPALEKAKAGVYDDEQFKDLPDAMKRKYFSRRSDGLWAVNGALKREVTFRRFNLMNTTFPFKHKFHVVFCRNVMIYFDQETKNKLVNRIYDFIEPEGYFFISHSETLDFSSCGFHRVVPSVYKKM